ncbi:MAG TPA: hypothetical protein VMB85_23810 [Bryobacteraceae bacterium]|nr:hypothetical protein [Bryobacteraceae bacterium]
MRKHIQSSLEQALRRLTPYFGMREKYAQTFSRTSKKQFPIESLVAAEEEVTESSFV